MTLPLATGARKALGLALPLILPALLVIAACGGDDESGGSEATASRAEATDGTEPTGGDEEPSPTEDDSGNGGGGEIDACSLLTDDEIEAVLGTPVTGAPDSDGVEQFSGCTWEGEGLAIVRVSVLSASKEEVTAYFEFAKNDSEAVDGLGDGAQWNDLTKSLEILVDDNTDVSITVAGSESDEKQTAIDLADKVLNRLP